MPFIYEPKGRAREYAELACNIYVRGPCYKCTYCFVRSMPGYAGDTRPDEPRPGVIDGIRKEAPKYKGREVHLCFMCDPFPPFVSLDHTTAAIHALLDGGCNVSLLTKQGERVISCMMSQFEPYRERIRYGATLTMDNDEDSAKWEPLAPGPDKRIASLRIMHNLGFRTWASFEPVIDPAQTLALMGRVQSCVDHYKIGRWNHDPRADKIDWPKFAQDARDLCERLGVKYTLKQDLARYL